MAFDMGFDFRGSAGFVTDPAYGVPVLTEFYPHTYTNSNGYSINAGWDLTTLTLDDVNTNDSRIAGLNYIANSPNARTFQVDLSSGSAPGAGNYTVDLAFGFSGNTEVNDFTLKDSSTMLIDGTNGGAGYTSAAGHYIDATLANVTASTTWTGSTVQKTFATTTAYLAIGLHALAANTTLNHFRLTLVPPASANILSLLQWALGR